MLVLISFALVLVAAVLLVIGLLSEQMELIYASIVCSALAGAVLVVATRVGRAKPLGASTGPTPLPGTAAAAVATPSAPPTIGGPIEPVTAPAPPPPPPAPMPEPVDEPVVESEPPAAPLPPPEMAPVPDPEPVVEATAIVPAVRPDFVVAGMDEEEDFFPIADYEELSSAEILPLLPELYADELDDVEQRERAGLGRSEILVRLMELKIAAQEEGVEGEPVPLVEATEVPQEVVVVDEVAVPVFPIPGYETLRVPEIRAQLTGLAPEDLATVRAHEVEHANRKTVLEAIDRLSRVPVARAVTKKAAATKKVTTTKASAAKTATVEHTSAKKAAAKKAAPAKRATSARKASPAKKAAAPPPMEIEETPEEASQATPEVPPEAPPVG